MSPAPCPFVGLLNPKKTLLGKLNAAALAKRGNAYLANGDWKFAIEDLTGALSLSPQDASLFASRSRAYQQKGDAANAGVDCKQAHALDPKAAC